MAQRSTTAASPRRRLSWNLSWAHRIGSVRDHIGISKSLRFRTISTPYRLRIISAPPWNRSTHSRLSRIQWCKGIWSGKRAAIWIKVSNHIQVSNYTVLTRARQLSMDRLSRTLLLTLLKEFKSRAPWPSPIPLVYHRTRYPTAPTHLILTLAHLLNRLRWITCVICPTTRAACKQLKVNSIRSYLLNSSTNRRSAMANCRSRTSRCIRSYARRWNKAFSVREKPSKTQLISLTQWVSRREIIAPWGKLSPIST